jgi:opacity protein-like surface antigen
MKTLIILLLALTLVIPAYAGQVFMSGQAIRFEADDDNFTHEPFLFSALEAGYSWKNVEAGIEGCTGSFKSPWDSHFRDTSAMATLKVKFSIKKFTPYFVGGIGERWFTNIKIGLTPANDPAESLLKHSSIAFKYGAGVQYAVTKNINLFIEATQRYGDTGIGSSIDTYGFGIGGGIKVYF